MTASPESSSTPAERRQRLRQRLQGLRDGLPARTDASGATAGTSETEEALTQNLVDDSQAFSDALAALTDKRPHT